MIRSGQKPCTPAKPEPVAAIRSAAPSSAGRLRTRCAVIPSEGQEGRAEERRRRNRADGERLEAEGREMERQQDGNVAIGEGAQRPCQKDPSPVRRRIHVRGGY